MMLMGVFVLEETVGSTTCTEGGDDEDVLVIALCDRVGLTEFEEGTSTTKV